jgi:prepilin-type N-terminal cleavage/methylation domain-containing protein
MAIQTYRRDEGFSLLELMMTVAVIATVASISVMMAPRMLSGSRADSASAIALNTLRLAHDRATAERRNFQVVFEAPNKIQTLRIEIGGGTTPISTVYLEGNQRFLKFDDMGDTPDAFGADAAVDFADPQIFTSEGSFIDGGGDVQNGTLFLAAPGQRDTARALTVFGATGLIRVWRWDGSRWVE